MLTLGKGSIFSLLHFWVIKNYKEETVIKINPRDSPRLHTISLLHPWPLKPAVLLWKRKPSLDHLLHTVL